ncbi:LPXTG-motif cell wall anchor domain-containing protein OS=Streptomyces microflavus OX=1919 GN=HUT09_07215 PE=4 SV=1 [Streptomyces microflavus]
MVNIATGDDEARYTARGARALPGGTVFREPQIDAWYVHDASRVLPLDEDATAAVGAKGTSLNAYRARVKEAYGDKLPGSGYAKSGKAGGYGPGAASAAEGPAPAPAPGPVLADAAGTGTPDTALTTVSTMAGAGALLALALGGATAVRHRFRTRRNPAPDA